jgi:hypothetical protein
MFEVIPNSPNAFKKQEGHSKLRIMRARFCFQFMVRLKQEKSSRSLTTLPIPAPIVSTSFNGIFAFWKPETATAQDFAFHTIGDRLTQRQRITVQFV